MRPNEAECGVFGCQRPPQVPTLLGEPGSLASMDLAVCAEHDNQMKAGAPWIYMAATDPTTRGCIYLDLDLAASDHWTASGLARRTDAVGLPDGSFVDVLELTLEQVGGVDRQVVRLLLTPGTATLLRLLVGGSGAS